MEDDDLQITKNISVSAHNNDCPPHSPTATFMEVLCRGEGKIRRFATGTKAGFALHRINRKLAVNVRAATCIEAVKDGEDPVEFGPDAELVIYGPGWRLQTLHEQDLDSRPVNPSLYHNQSKQPRLGSLLVRPSSLGFVQVCAGPNSSPFGLNRSLCWNLFGAMGELSLDQDWFKLVRAWELDQNPSEFYPTSKVKRRSNSKLSVQYFAKIALAFCFVFFLAGTFMLILENLPRFLLYLQA